jgi:hypothetical protein
MSCPPDLFVRKRMRPIGGARGQASCLPKPGEGLLAPARSVSSGCACRQDATDRLVSRGGAALPRVHMAPKIGGRGRRAKSLPHAARRNSQSRGVVARKPPENRLTSRGAQTGAQKPVRSVLPKIQFPVLRAASIAARSSGSSGVTLWAKVRITCPSLPTRTLWKFHFGASCLAVRNL